MVKKSLQLKKNQINILIIVGAILFSLIIVFVLAVPIWKKMQKTNQELKQERIRLEKLEEKLTNLKNLKDKEDELKEKNEKVLAALPKDKDVSRLFVQIENIATGSGLNVREAGETDQSATQDKGAGKLVPITYKLIASANNYGGIKSVLLKLEQALRLVSINEINISKDGKAFELTSTFVTYIRGDQK